MKRLTKKLVSVFLLATFALSPLAAFNVNAASDTIKHTQGAINVSDFLSQYSGSSEYTGYGVGVYSDSNSDGQLTLDEKLGDSAPVKTGCYLYAVKNDDNAVTIKKQIAIVGDVNCDGAINSDDAKALLAHLKGTALTGIALDASDCNNDGKTDIGDLLMISKIGVMSYPTGYSVSATANATEYEEGGVVQYKIDVAPQGSHTVAYVEFIVTYDKNVLEFIGGGKGIGAGWNTWDVDVPVDTEGRILIKAQTGGFAGTSSTAPVLNLQFTAKSVTTDTQTKLSVSGCIGVDTNAKYVVAASAESTQVTIKAPVAAGPTLTTPTVKTSDSSSITINVAAGHEYAIATTATNPALTWKTPTAGTTAYKFDGLQSSKTYYIYYRVAGTSAANTYIMATTTASVVVGLPGPVVDDSTKTSLRFDMSEYVDIYISLNSAKPTHLSKWLSVLHSTSGSNYNVGSAQNVTYCTYSVDHNSIVTFSDLVMGRYYVYGRDTEGNISNVTICAPVPDFTFGDEVKVNSDYSVSAKWGLIYQYSIDGVNWKSVYSGDDYLDSARTIKISHKTANDANVTITGLKVGSQYTLYVRVVDGSVPISENCEVKFTLDNSTLRPNAPVSYSKTETSLTFVYEKGVLYSVGSTQYWTIDWSSRGYYPVKNFPAELGSIKYYFDSDTNPSLITFTGLSQYTTYNIYARYASDSVDSLNFALVTAQTKMCWPHLTNDSGVCTVCGYKSTSGGTSGGTTTCKHTSTTEKVGMASTCTTAGYKIVECNSCKAEVSRTPLPLAQHTLSTRTVASTCTTQGYTETYCTVCGYVSSKTLSPLSAHAYTNVVVPATCLSKGYNGLKCSVCGQLEIVANFETIPHTPASEWITVIEPTVETSGVKELRCTVCQTVVETGVIEKLVNKVTNPNGTVTYIVNSEENYAVLTDAANSAASENGGVKVVYASGISVELDRVMSAAFMYDNATLAVVEVKSAAEASGNITAAGFNTNVNKVYEITASNAMFVGTGSATVEIPYENVTGLTVSAYYVDAQGNKTKVPAAYDSAKKTVTLTLDHFSTYVISEEVEVAKPSGNGMGATIAIIAIAAVVLVTGVTLGYIVYTSKNSKVRKFKF